MKVTVVVAMAARLKPGCPGVRDDPDVLGLPKC